MMRVRDPLLILVVLVAVLAGELCLLDDHADIDSCFVLLVLPTAASALAPLMPAGRIRPLASGSIDSVPHRPPPPPI